MTTTGAPPSTSNTSSDPVASVGKHPAGGKGREGVIRRALRRRFPPASPRRRGVCVQRRRPRHSSPRSPRLPSCERGDTRTGSEARRIEGRGSAAFRAFFAPHVHVGPSAGPVVLHVCRSGSRKGRSRNFRCRSVSAQALPAFCACPERAPLALGKRREAPAERPAAGKRRFAHGVLHRGSAGRFPVTGA